MALAAGEATVAGRIAPGIRADPTALGIDPVAAPSDEVARSPLWLTVTGGHVAHGAVRGVSPVGSAWPVAPARRSREIDTAPRSFGARAYAFVGSNDRLGTRSGTSRGSAYGSDPYQTLATVKPKARQIIPPTASSQKWLAVATMTTRVAVG